MNWLGSLARIVGTANPITALGVQALAELDGRSIQARLRRLEDPIGSLHPDVGELSDAIYAELSEADDSHVELSDEILDRYSRVLAVLDAAGLIQGTHSLHRRFVGGVWLTNPTFVLYIAGLYEDPDLMERTLAHLNAAPSGTWLRGPEIAKEFAMPLPVIRAFFQLFAQRGLGTLSAEIGVTNYRVQA
ncbi:MAG TPA: hypothetical protein VGM82_09760 [Gemmatimonadaceae bacterium]|jgi:hypothetical protein